MYDAAMAGNTEAPRRAGRRCAAFVAVLILAAVTSAAAAEPPALVKARTLYNGGNFEGAIDAAAVARRQPQFSDAAALVIARSYLERYRQRADPADLTSAREALASVKAGSLAPRDQVGLLVGLGQWLYLAEIYGAAAELFDSALNQSELMAPADRTLLLDWWATALDHEASDRAPDQRGRAFERISSRMEAALREDPGNGPANYWLAAAARGSGDLDRAWAAAIAAWVRSSLEPESAQELRADLDRLVSQALIPERVRQRPAREQEDAAATLRDEWEMVKAQWP
jgi:hypothetical protein